MRIPRLAIWLVLLTASLNSIACAAPLPTTNPSIPFTEDDAKKLIDQMHQHPAKQARPLIIVGGYREFLTLGPSIASSRLTGMFQDPKVIRISLAWCSSFDDCRKTIINAVEKNFPSQNPNATIEVDVVGQSMGGIASAYAADESRPGKHLKIRTLFTLSSPWLGATRADEIPFVVDDCQRAMRHGSEFLKQLNDAKRTYEVVPYTRLLDRTVGEANAAPRGMTPIWLPASAFEVSHFFGCIDYRAMADIGRRLRGELPLSQEIREPLPVPRKTKL